MTGKNPGRHGVFDFIRRRSGGFDMVNSSHIASKTLWQILSEAGKRVGVMSVPVTYPTRPVNGFLISGLLSPRQGDITYPRDLLEGYEAELGPYRISPDVQYTQGNEEAFVADLMRLLDQRARYALRLMQDRGWDFFMVHFVALDTAQHSLWRTVESGLPSGQATDPTHGDNPLLRLYRKADAILAELWAQLAAEDMLLVMSDHGFGPLHGTVNLNNHLMQHGFLHLRRDLATKVRFGLFRRGITPSAAYHLLVKLGLQNVVVRVSKRARNAVVGRFLSFSSVDWSRTQAYALGHVGQIFINERGKEPNGCVEPEDYAAVRQRVADSLKLIRHPDTGQPLVDEVVFREDAYEGPYARLGADILVTMDRHRFIAFPMFAGDSRLVAPQVRGDSGCHRMNGILFASGASVRCGSVVEGARIVDLAPTLLYRMGVPVPSDMDGSILTELFEPAFVGDNPAMLAESGTMDTPDHEWRPDEAAEIEARLRSLGYLG
jgi:predicted AlkP superfamily phosphohydrolase/phosphomutase